MQQGQTAVRHNYRKWISILLLAIVTCMFCIKLIDYIAQQVHHGVDFKNSYEVPRNPYFLRGWDEYTVVPESATNDDVYTVVVISNSQGFMQEIEDGNLTYSKQLESILQQQMGRPVKVLNWSVVASNAAEHIILAARAVEHQPDAILWVAYENNMTQAKWQELSYYSTDIPRMAYDLSTRQHLSPDFLAGHQAYNLYDWINATTGVGKLIHLFEEERFLVWWWKFEGVGFSVRVRDWTDQSVAYMYEFYNTIHNSAPEIPIVFVSMPLNRSQYDDDQWAQVSSLADRVQSIYDPLDNIIVVDAISAIPNDLFVTHTHLRVEGHRMFAEWLYQKLWVELGLGN